MTQAALSYPDLLQGITKPAATVVQLLDCDFTRKRTCPAPSGVTELLHRFAQLCSRYVDVMMYVCTLTFAVSRVEYNVQ